MIGYSAEVVADSVSPDGVRLTLDELLNSYDWFCTTCGRLGHSYHAKRHEGSKECAKNVERSRRLAELGVQPSAAYQRTVTRLSGRVS